MKKMLSRMLTLLLCLCMAAPGAMAAETSVVLPEETTAEAYRSIRHVEQVGDVVYLMTSGGGDAALALDEGGGSGSADPGGADLGGSL